MSLALQSGRKKKKAYVHNIVVNDKSRPTGGGIVAQADLTNATVSTKELIQVFTLDVVIQVLHEEDAICSRRELGL